MSMTFRTLKNYTKKTFQESVAEQMADLNQILNTNDVNKQVNILIYYMETAIYQCPPYINVLPISIPE